MYNKKQTENQEGGYFPVDVHQRLKERICQVDDVDETPHLVKVTNRKRKEKTTPITRSYKISNIKVVSNIKQHKGKSIWQLFPSRWREHNASDKQKVDEQQLIILRINHNASTALERSVINKPVIKSDLAK